LTSASVATGAGATVVAGEKAAEAALSQLLLLTSCALASYLKCLSAAVTNYIYIHTHRVLGAIINLNIVIMPLI